MFEVWVRAHGQATGCVTRQFETGSLNTGRSGKEVVAGSLGVAAWDGSDLGMAAWEWQRLGIGSVGMAAWEWQRGNGSWAWPPLDVVHVGLAPLDVVHLGLAHLGVARLGLAPLGVASSGCGPLM